VTYLIRMLPLIFCRKEISNRYVKSFLYYIPYTVLTAMTFPAIFYSTGSTASAIVGTALAIALAYFGRGLLTVAIGATATVFITELIMSLI
ncbi:MAG: AzlD domain-containing protein, partial [Clostridia bacterium]|nr:AzlD domain-containing protein [Clostridia bacterium]